MPQMWHFDCDTTFNVIVSLLNERFDGFNYIRFESVKTGLQIVIFWQLRRFFCTRKLEIPTVTFWHIDG